MAVQIMSLMSGKLPFQGTSQMYQSPLAPTALTTIVKGIRLVNTDSVAQTVNLYLNRSLDSAPRYLTPKNLIIPPSGLFIDDQEITMSAGDSITYDTTATRIDFTIFGVQR
jgi:hypothetical protein